MIVDILNLSYGEEIYYRVKYTELRTQALLHSDFRNDISLKVVKSSRFKSLP